jgi:hypothetical protein
MTSGQILIIAIAGVIGIIIFFVIGKGGFIQSITPSTSINPSTTQSANPVISANPETSMGTGAIGAGGISNSFIYEPVNESTYNLSYSPYTNVQQSNTYTQTYSPYNIINPSSISTGGGSGGGGLLGSLISLGIPIGSGNVSGSGNTSVQNGNMSLTIPNQGNAWRNEMQAAQSINSQNQSGFQSILQQLGWHK